MLKRYWKKLKKKKTSRFIEFNFETPNVFQLLNDIMNETITPPNDQMIIEIKDNKLIIEIKYKHIKETINKEIFKFENVTVIEDHEERRVIGIEVDIKGEGIKHLLCSINCCFTMMKPHKQKSIQKRINDLFNVIVGNSKAFEDLLEEKRLELK